MTLALYIAYWLELDNAYWAATSASIVCQPILGAALRKARFRAVGTTIGAVVAVVLTALYPQNRAGFLVGLGLWCALSGFFATILRNFAGYGSALAGYTAVIVFTGAADHPDETFHVAVTRGTEICIGIFAAGLVQVLTDFGDARERLIQVLSDTAHSIVVGLGRTISSGTETYASRVDRRELIRRVIALDGAIDTALGEASDLRSRAGWLHGSVEGLFSALSAWRGIANHLTSVSEGAPTLVRGTLLSAVDAAAKIDWSTDGWRARAVCRGLEREAASIPVLSVELRILVDGVAKAFAGLARAANGLVLVTEPGREEPDKPGGRLHVPDVLPAIIVAARTGVALLAVDLLWIGGSWSGGQDAISFAAIGVLLFSPRWEAGYSLALGWTFGTIISAGLAAIVDFAILPSRETFGGLAGVLFIVMVPFGALAAGKWQPGLFSAVVTNFFPLLTPANQQVYDIASFYNTALAIIVGAAIATMCLKIIPPLGPERRTARLLALTLRDVRRMAVGRHDGWDQAAWLGHISHRLSALPSVASLDDAARLLAALSVGEAIILLRGTPRHSPADSSARLALACLAQGDLQETRNALADYELQQSREEACTSLDVMRARAAAAVIADAVARHSDYFGSGRMASL